MPISLNYTDLSEIFRGEDENYIIRLLGGDDRFSASQTFSGIDLIYGGSGNDIIQARLGDDFLFGGYGNDVLIAENGNDLAYGGYGNDRIYGGNGQDQLYGGNNKDTLFGGNSHDTLHGGSGHDLLRGGTGNDILLGENGNDELRGESGNDQLFGGSGNDLLIAGQGNNTLTGGAGADQFQIEVGTSTVTDFDSTEDTVLIHGNLVSDYFIDGNYLVSEVGAVFGTVSSSDGNVTIVSGNQDMTVIFENTTIDDLGIEMVMPDYEVFGTQGADRLFYDSETGPQHLFGLGGNDLLIGTRGDTLTGGEGRDNFSVFNGDITITDFNPDEDRVFANGQGSNPGGYRLSNEIIFENYILNADGTVSSETQSLDNNESLVRVEETPNGVALVIANGSNIILEGYTFEDMQGLFASPPKYDIETGSTETINDFEVGDTIILADYDVSELNASAFDGTVLLDDARRPIGTVDTDGDNITLTIGDTSVTVNGATLADLEIDTAPPFDGAIGTDGDDVFNGTSTVRFYEGLDGNDTINGGAGYDSLSGGNGDDEIYGNSGFDRLYGGQGDDMLYGGRGWDQLYATSGNNGLYGGTDVDRFIVSGGTNEIHGGNGSGAGNYDGYGSAPVIIDRAEITGGTSTITATEKINVSGDAIVTITDFLTLEQAIDLSFDGIALDDLLISADGTALFDTQGQSIGAIADQDGSVVITINETNVTLIDTTIADLRLTQAPNPTTLYGTDGVDEFTIWAGENLEGNYVIPDFDETEDVLYMYAFYGLDAYQAYHYDATTGKLIAEFEDPITYELYDVSMGQISEVDGNTVFTIRGQTTTVLDLSQSDIESYIDF